MDGKAERGQQYLTAVGPVEGIFQEEVIPGGWNVQEEHKETPNNTHEKPYQGDYNVIVLCVTVDLHSATNHMKKRI